MAGRFFMTTKPWPRGRTGGRKVSGKNTKIIGGVYYDDDVTNTAMQRLRHIYDYILV